MSNAWFWSVNLFKMQIQHRPAILALFQDPYFTLNVATQNRVVFIKQNVYKIKHWNVLIFHKEIIIDSVKKYYTVIIKVTKWVFTVMSYSRTIFVPEKEHISEQFWQRLKVIYWYLCFHEEALTPMETFQGTKGAFGYYNVLHTTENKFILRNIHWKVLWGTHDDFIFYLHRFVHGFWGYWDVKQLFMLSCWQIIYQVT